MPLMSGVRALVGVVFVMHVHQLQVRDAMRRSLLSLCVPWHLQHESRSLVIAGVGGGGEGGQGVGGW